MTVTHHDEARLIGPRGEADNDFLGAAGGLMGAGKDFGKKQKGMAQSEQQRLQKKYPDATFRNQ
ncbi:MAG: hypothetical protein ACSHYB_12525 [Roseibacillus sp.]